MKSKIKQGAFWLLLAILLAAAGSFLMGFRTVFVRSGSMEPAFQTGSICLINTKIPKEKIQKGDVIVFSAGENRTPVMHRVEQITKQGYRTKGDANQRPDPWVIGQEQISGKVIGSIPYLGYGLACFASPVGLLLWGSAGAYAGARILKWSNPI